MKPIIAFLALIICTKFSLAQTPEAGLDTLNSRYPDEKIFIHYDKENYIAGETIWFKTYITAGYIPTLYSTTVSIDLMTSSGDIISKKVLPIINGVAAGNIDIDTSVANGNYIIRAYTPLMMAAGESKCYNHTLAIFNTKKKGQTQSEPQIFQTYLLPEGGNLVTELVNTVAFKSTDQWGVPEDVTVKLFNSKNEEITESKSEHDGMGYFMFIPEEAEKYYTIAKYKNGSEIKKDLVQPLANGIILSVKNHERGKVLTILKSPNIPDNWQPSYVLGVMENKKVFKLDLKQDKTEWQNVIPDKDLPSGIMQVTVFNKEHKPLAERLTFINHNDFIKNLDFKSTLTGFEPRSKNEYSIEIPDTMNASYSISVTDVNREIYETGSDDIVSRLLLTNDIKGYVNNPSYYFKTDDKKVKEDLELLLMTSGWRRYSWDEIINNKIPKFSSRDDFFITVTGTAKKEISKSAFNNDEMIGFISTKDSAKNFLTIPINTDGSFKIEGLIFRDTATLLLQNNAKKYKDKALKFNVTSPTIFSKMMMPFNEKNYKIKSLKELIDESKITRLQSSIYYDMEGDILPDVIVKTRAKSPTELLEDKYVSGAYGGFATRTLDFVNDPMYKTANGMFVLDYIDGRIPGISVVQQDGEYTLVYRNSGGQMHVLLDEMQTDVSAISAIPVSQVALIKIYSSMPGLTGGGAGGAIAVYLKKGNDVDYDNTFSTLRRLKLIGYSPVKQFFSPDYADQTLNNGKTDIRTTLYWNPYISTSGSNKTINFNFYNNDTGKKIRVIVQGFSMDGHLISYEKIIE